MFHVKHYHQATRGLGLPLANIFMASIPKMKPPIWANHATPPAPWENAIWTKNQTVRSSMAGTSMVVMNRKDKDERLNLGPREEYQIGAQDAGDGPARADHRHRGGRVEGILHEARGNPGQKIEENEPHMARRVFHIVPEYP